MSISIPPYTQSPLKLRMAYELGRLRAAIPWMITALALAVLAYATKQQTKLVWAGLILIAAVGTMRWAGQAWNHVARLGLSFGMIPYLAALSAPLLGHHCEVGGCSSLCLPLCGVAGISAGWLAVKPIVKQRLGLGYGAATLLMILSVSAFACSCLGMASTLGVATGLGVGSVLRIAWMPRS